MDARKKGGVDWRPSHALETLDLAGVACVEAAEVEEVDALLCKRGGDLDKKGESYQGKREKSTIGREMRKIHGLMMDTSSTMPSTVNDS